MISFLATRNPLDGHAFSQRYGLVSS
jgi:hypothetical protein